MRLLAADLFLEKFHSPWKRGSVETKRPLGPFGMAGVHSCSATFGVSRLATAHALGGLKIKAPLPETRNFVVGGVVPRADIGRQELSEPLGVFERLADGIG